MSSSLKLIKKINERAVVFDGAMGTEIYKHDFFVNTSFDALNINAPDVIKEIHSSYIEAGSDIITTNTFAANRSALMKFGLADQTEKINKAAVQLAKECTGDKDVLVAASIGPVASTVSCSKNEAKIVDIVTEQLNALISAEPDLIIFETISNIRDAFSAMSALQQIKQIPEFILSFSVDRNGKTKHGEDIEMLIRTLDKFDICPTALGLNCSSGPEGLIKPTEKLLSLTKLPVIIQPNAGMPKEIDGRMIYMASPEYLATYALKFINIGVKGVGGCCGTGPEHIKEISRMIKKISSAATRSPVKGLKKEVVLKTPVQPEKRSKFASKIVSGNWVTTIEIVPPKGFDLSKTIEKAIFCRNAGIDAVNIPDGPRASCRISPIIAALEIQNKAKIETILHFCCRDRNLIGMQADLLGCAALGINNLLFITGDPPKLGHFPDASAVFDADSIGMVQVQNRLNCGVDLGGDPINEKTRAYIGVGADPNAIDFEREIHRTEEKVKAGAEFIITQPVFDIKPLIHFLKTIKHLKIPVIAGIWPLASYRNAEFMKNEVPGVVVPDEIMRRMAKADTKEAQKAEGIAIAVESIKEIRNIVNGIQVSAPFGNVNTAVEVIKSTS